MNEKGTEMNKKMFVIGGLNSGRTLAELIAVQNLQGSLSIEEKLEICDIIEKRAQYFKGIVPVNAKAFCDSWESIKVLDAWCLNQRQALNRMKDEFVTSDNAPPMGLRRAYIINAVNLARENLLISSPIKQADR